LDRRFSYATIARMDDLNDDGEPGVRSGGDPPDPYEGEPKYAAWKVTLFVILFCGAFWAGLSYLAMRLFG
jgi:hypothetical protein